MVTLRPIGMPVSTWVNGVRRRLGLSAAGLGRLLHVSKRTIYRWEQGQSVPHDVYVERMEQLVDEAIARDQEATDAVRQEQA